MGAFGFRRPKTITTKRALLTSFFVDVIDIITNVVVAIITGSAVMLAETFQGLADLSSVGLLLIGNRRAGKTPTRIHPFGFGKEAYFWAVLSAVIILFLTATLSFYSGLKSYLSPEPVQHVFLAYVVLALGMASNGYAFSVSARKILEGKNAWQLPRAFMRTAHIAPRTTLVLDSLGFLAAFFGFAALALYGLSGDAQFDGIGAMAIGVLLASASIVLLLNIKAYITGKRASPEAEAAIERAALSVPDVKAVLDLRTMMLGSENLLINLELHFKDGLVTDELEHIIDNVKVKVADAVPGHAYIQIEPETPKRHQRRHNPSAHEQ